MRDAAAPHPHYGAPMTSSPQPPHPPADRAISETIEVAASPEAVFALLADPRRHPEFDGSGTVRQALVAPPRLFLGAKFGMSMRIGLPYAVRNTVVEFDESRQIAWRHFGRHVWRYQLEPTAGGTRVTETFDYAPALSPRLLERTGMVERNRGAVHATLLRLRDLFAAGPAS